MGIKIAGLHKCRPAIKFSGKILLFQTRVLHRKAFQRFQDLIRH